MIVILLALLSVTLTADVQPGDAATNTVFPNGLSVTLDECTDSDATFCKGLYTPDITNLAGSVTACSTVIGSPHLYQMRYWRFGSVVHVHGSFTCDLSSSTGLAGVNISLPIPTNLDDTSDCGGVASSATSSNEKTAGFVYFSGNAGASNCRVDVDNTTGGLGTDRPINVSFSYIIKDLP